MGYAQGDLEHTQGWTTPNTDDRFVRLIDLANKARKVTSTDPESAAAWISYCREICEVLEERICNENNIVRVKSTLK